MVSNLALAPKRYLVAFLFVVFAGVVFASVKAFIKGLENVPVVEVIFFRGVVSLIICLVTLWVRSRASVSDASLPWSSYLKNKWLWKRGILGTLGLACAFLSVRLLPLAAAATLQKLAPLFAACFGVYWFREAISLRVVFALVIGLLGVGIMNQYAGGLEVLGLAVAVVGAMCTGASYATIRGLENIDPTIVVLSVPVVLLPGFLLPMLQSWVTPTWSEWGVILFIGVFVQVAQLCLTRGFQRGKTAIVGVGLYFEVVAAALLGLVFFGEQLDLYAYMATGCIFVASMLVFTAKPKEGAS